MDAVRKNRPRATIADLFAIPEATRFHELINGEIIEKGAATGAHGGVQAELTTRLNGPFGRRPGGRWPGGWWFAIDVDIRFGEDVCRPDVVAWRRDRVTERPLGALVSVRPDWVCEILSTNHRNDLVRKKHIYHRHEVGHYWILDPVEETLAVYRWHPAGYLEVLAAESGNRVRAEPFDAIELPVGALFGKEEDEGEGP
ncbi:MAG TPA: Uma2 family endonuclease [Polyangia bacterium]|jgi:Uma2 family endonuclease|nr:Uma2 family endonuclease [Polyangia bacterium]